MNLYVVLLILLQLKKQVINPIYPEIKFRKVKKKIVRKKSKLKTTNKTKQKKN